jgi:cytidylate kinase
MSKKMIVAIDGPAAAGKGTLARRLAAALDLPYLDTGLLYRATARLVLDAGHDAHDPVADLERNDLRSPEVDQAAASVASIPGVRAALLAFQRQFGAERGAVLDGRDIGTVIFPDADVKLYVDANVDARALRRWKELAARGMDVSLQSVTDDMQARDAADVARAAAPLRPAEDAVVLDTSGLDADAAFQKALGIVKEAVLF